MRIAVAADLVGRAPADLVGSVACGRSFRRRSARAQGRCARAMVGALELHNPATSRWIEIGLYPSPEGMTAFARDVTARHEAEATIRFQGAALGAGGRGRYCHRS
ncbi:MAG: hypothetical protein U0531_18185 [Dehalococcoidia bacterium]